jgi:hypothetical protein
VEGVVPAAVAGVVGLDLESLEELGQCLEVADGVFVELEQVLAHEVAAIGVAQEGLVLPSDWVLGGGSDLRREVQDDVEDLVVALLDREGGGGRVPEVLLVRTCPVG